MPRAPRSALDERRVQLVGVLEVLQRLDALRGTCSRARARAAGGSAALAACVGSPAMPFSSSSTSPCQSRTVSRYDSDAPARSMDALSRPSRHSSQRCATPRARASARRIATVSDRATCGSRHLTPELATLVPTHAVRAWPTRRLRHCTRAASSLLTSVRRLRRTRRRSSPPRRPCSAPAEALEHAAIASLLRGGLSSA